MPKGVVQFLISREGGDQCRGNVRNVIYLTEDKSRSRPMRTGRIFWNEEFKLGGLSVRYLSVQESQENNS